MANLIFDLMDLNCGMNSMKDSSVVLTGKLPTIFDSLFVKTSCKHNVNTRFASRSTFYLPKIRTNYGQFNIRFNGPKLWNELDERFKCRTSNQYKKDLTSHFISLY